MILCVGVESDTIGEWKDVYKFPFISNSDLGDGMMEITQKGMNFDGEVIAMYSIISVNDLKLVLGVEQDGRKLVELTCSGELDMVCSTKKNRIIRFYTRKA